MKAVPIDSVAVRHDFLRFETAYHEICLKRANRGVSGGESRLAITSRSISPR